MRAALTVLEALPERADCGRVVRGALGGCVDAGGGWRGAGGLGGDGGAGGGGGGGAAWPQRVIAVILSGDMLIISLRSAWGGGLKSTAAQWQWQGGGMAV
jgi:hypothetical protein